MFETYEKGGVNMPVSPDGITDISTLKELESILREFGHNPKRLGLQHPDVPPSTPQVAYLCETCGGVALFVTVSDQRGMRFAGSITTTLLRQCESVTWLEVEIPDALEMAGLIADDTDTTP